MTTELVWNEVEKTLEFRWSRTVAEARASHFELRSRKSTEEDNMATEYIQLNKDQKPESVLQSNYFISFQR